MPQELIVQPSHPYEHPRAGSYQEDPLNMGEDESHGRAKNAWHRLEFRTRVSHRRTSIKTPCPATSGVSVSGGISGSEVVALYPALLGRFPVILLWALT